MSVPSSVHGRGRPQRRHLQAKLRRSARCRLRLSDVEDDGVARSARTRRMPGRRTRCGALRRAAASMCGSHVIKRVGRRFSHKSSPARRGRSRQDVSFTCGPKRLATSEDQDRSDASFRYQLCRPAARLPASLLPSRLLRGPCPMRISSLSPWEGLRNFDTEQPFPSCDRLLHAQN